MIDKEEVSKLKTDAYKKGSKEAIMKFFGALKDLDIDWDKKEKAMKEFREEVEERMNNTARKMNQNLK